MIPSFRPTLNGIKFRSHLEARWSVCLSALNISWRYEPAWHHLPSGRYLPDFLLADRVWLEIKPPTFPGRATQRCSELHAITGQSVCLFAGAFEEGFVAHCWPTQYAGPQEALLAILGATGWSIACRKARAISFQDHGHRPFAKTEGTLPWLK